MKVSVFEVKDKMFIPVLRLRFALASPQTHLLFVFCSSFLRLLFVFPSFFVRLSFICLCGSHRHLSVLASNSLRFSTLFPSYKNFLHFISHLLILKFANLLITTALAARTVINLVLSAFLALRY